MHTLLNITVFIEHIDKENYGFLKDHIEEVLIRGKQRLG